MQRIGFVVLPGFQMMSVAVLSVFEFANNEMGESVYDVHLLSETGGSIRSSIDVIARQTGFADRDRMRRAFLRTFGQPPQVIRRNGRAEATA